MKREPHVSLMFKNYVNGHWEIGATTGVANNPSDLDETIGEYARADVRQTDAAVGAATAAFDEWSHSPLTRRAELLEAIGNEITTRKLELARVLAREIGKPLAEAIAETGRAGAWFKFFAAQALHTAGECFGAAQPGVEMQLYDEPLGVVGIISPWSFPYEVPALKLAAALAYGNCVVFKPAESASVSAWHLAEVISRSGMPAGVFNLVMGSGRQVGARLATHPEVDALSFSGSAAVATLVARAAAERQCPLQIETGGNNTLVVLADADFAAALQATLDSAYGSAGQRADATSRVIVERSLLSRFVEALQVKVSRIKVDHALKHGVQCGPLANLAQLERVLECVRVSQTDGAEKVCGGGRLERATRGHFFEPALVLGRAEQRVASETVFGPILSVVSADDVEHALQLTHRVPDARYTALYTSSLKQARQFRRVSRAAVSLVNLPSTAPAAYLPVGSGALARARGREASSFYTRPKLAYAAL